MSFRSLFSMFAVFICSAALILGLTANPSFASTSSPTKGETQLDQTTAAAEQVADKSAPMGLKEVTARSNSGINEVQGAADAGKMYKANTSEPGPSLAKKLDKALDKAVK